MKVEVTQYMRPNGRRVSRVLDIDDACREKFQQIIDNDARLTYEQLMTSQASQAIETNDGDFDITLTKGTDLDENKKALEDMILRFDLDVFAEWKGHFE